MRKHCSGLAQTGASGTTDVDEAVRQARIVWLDSKLGITRVLTTVEEVVEIREELPYSTLAGVLGVGTSLPPRMGTPLELWQRPGGQ